MERGGVTAREGAAGRPFIEVEARDSAAAPTFIVGEAWGSVVAPTFNVAPAFSGEAPAQRVFVVAPGFVVVGARKVVRRGRNIKRWQKWLAPCRTGPMRLTRMRR